MYKSPPPESAAEQFYETAPGKPYKRGFSIQTVSPLPITWAEHVAAQGHWGARLREYMSDYVTGPASVPCASSWPSRATGYLAAEKDGHGLPVAHSTYSQCDNDRSW